MTEIESSAAWGWALESIASSKHVTLSLLHDLISQTPPNLPDDIRRSVTERVALRCLEDLFAAHDAPPVPRSKLSLDFSESCEEVLKRIVNETEESDVWMGGGGKWKWEWDIEPFIKHKRDCMPKCTLNKLKDLLVDGSHPYAEMFGRKSRLASVRVDGSDDVFFNGGCSNAKGTSVEEERNDGSVLSPKRNRNASETEKVGCENYVDDGLCVNAKKTKRDGSYGLQSAEDTPVPFVGRDMLEDSLRRDVPGSGRGKCVLSEFKMDLREERCALEVDRDDYSASKRSEDAIHNPCADKAKDDSGFCPEPTTSGGAPPNERQDDVSAKDSSCNIEHETHIEVPQPVSVRGYKQASLADQGKDDSEICPELTTLRVATPDKAQQKVSAKESDQNNERASHINTTHPGSAYVSQKKRIADGVKDHSCLDYVAMEKSDFLSSKGISTRYFYSTDKDRCLMCNGGGQLLICTTSDCPMAYHESCMGSKFISYENGNFYCPFCAYSLHLTEFLEVEKEASRLRKDLYTFVCVLGAS